MKRELRISGDGSHTFYVPSMDETYHSLHGALQESAHVFIENGFRFVQRSPVRILELGFGTGLNVLLTIAASNRSGVEVYYHTVEKYPLTSEEYQQLNYDRMIPDLPDDCSNTIHRAEWECSIAVTKRFLLYKEKVDFRHTKPEGMFDLVYFDVFSPDKQPHLWETELFSRLYDLMNPGAALVTYSSKGIVRRVLISCGFDVEKLPGPPGKREMTRAVKR